MRVSIDKLTGKIIGSQSGGKVYPDPKVEDREYDEKNLETLRQNVTNAGYKNTEVEVKYVTQEEYKTLLETSKPVLTKDES